MKFLSFLIVGGIVIIFGIVFNLQGNAVVGPESSFMYSNPDWVVFGLEIVLVGIAINGIGMILKKFGKI